MDVHITLDGVRDLTAAIYRQLADAIAEGALPAGSRLPATRELAIELGVARNTVGAAYDRLMAEGLTVARVGSGTFVADIPRRGSAPAPRASTALRPSALIAGLSAGSVGTRTDPVPFDFGIGTPDAAAFPKDAWRREITHALRPTSPYPGQYGDAAGLLDLRQALARHIRVARAVRADPDDLLITSGAQHAVSLLARVLLVPGDTVVVEDPGYPPIRALLATLGARILNVPVDAEGIRVDLLPDRAALVYTTPSHQFPLGMPMSQRRREQLLAWADSAGAAVVEDDYDSEFRYGRRPLDSLHSLDRSGRVVYVGTFSKSLLPGVRLGFLVAPPSLRDGLRLVRRVTDWSQDPVPQAALAELIDSGLFATRVRSARRTYAARHDALIGSLERELTGTLTAIPSHAGIHLTAYLDPASPRSARRIVELAAARGVRVEALDEYYSGTPGASGIVLGFGRVAVEQIPAGIRMLADAATG